MSPRTGAAARRIAIALVPIAGVLGGCGSGSDHAKTTSTQATPPTQPERVALGCRSSAAGDRTTTTGSHVFLLRVSPATAIVSRVRARAGRAKTGEFVLRGRPPGVRRGAASLHHVDVHICDRKSGKVVTGAKPVVTLKLKGGRAARLAVAEEQRVGAGASDDHYGANVSLRTGGTYTVSVRLGSDGAIFSYSLSRG